MSVPLSLPGTIEYSLVHFHLEFLEPFALSFEVLLRLRRDLHTAGRQVLGDRYGALFDPALPLDPVALRRHQRPGPPFVLSLNPEQAGRYDVGDRMLLSVFFWGTGTQRLGDFAAVLQRLGRLGLHRGEGAFELVAIDAEDSAGNRLPLSMRCPLGEIAPPVNDLRWWLETFAEVDSIVLEFVTPARLLSHGRPLFRIDFARLFPYILRRVSSVFYAHCGCEVLTDPSALLTAATEVAEADNLLFWDDWRLLEGPVLSQELGGISGSIALSGDALKPLLWILRSGTLLNLGKGASYGSGRFRLRPPGPLC